MYKCLFLIWFVIGFVLAAKAQKLDTGAVKSKSEILSQKHDSVTSKRFVPKVTKEKVYHPDTLHDPHKAVIRSLIIPGWGQLYNHRWWKLPFVYTGLGLLGDVIIFNQHYYSIFLKEALLREKGADVKLRNPLLSEVNDADVVTYTDLYRRNRDLGILGTVGFWGVQMIDAYIDAKFIRSYTMDNNLSFKVSPGIINQPVYALNNNGAIIPAIKITFTLR
jgi:Family of unknown function (DUF5683)